ncbi:MAG TPA: hypothetical protein VGA53_03710 [Candidatus Paceibacterota bacterium]
MDLIPKQEQKPLFGQWFFLIASFLLLAGVGIGFFVLDQLEQSSREALETIERTLQEEIQPQEQSLVEELQRAREKIDRFKLAAERRKDFLPLFQILEESTHEGVVFSSFQTNRQKAQITLAGTAQNFFVLEQQRLLWKRQPQIKEIVIQGMKLEQDGQVSFDADLTL